jgi:hypothetical protein
MTKGAPVVVVHKPVFIVVNSVVWDLICNGNDPKLTLATIELCEARANADWVTVGTSNNTFLEL